MPSIGAGYLQDIAGIPSAYTNLLEMLGYTNTPFQNVDQGFSSIEGFQRSLKSILDRQLSAYGGAAPDNNLNYLPLNLRNIYSEAAPIMTDPMYGIIGAPGFFSGGYKPGELPSGHSMAYQTLLDQRNAPAIPPPNVSNAASASLGSGGGNSGGGGGGSDSGSHMGLDSNGNIITINKPYGSMTDEEKDAANRYGRQYPGGGPSSNSSGGGGGGGGYVAPPMPNMPAPTPPMIGGPSYSRRSASYY
jgi:hypothetical protein